jgi:hypothetical protein
MFSEEKDPEKLWAVILSLHKVHSISKVTGVVKRSARKGYLQTRQGVYESLLLLCSIEVVCQSVKSKMDDPDIAMCFFDGLDDGRYAQFKTEIHNNMIVGTITKLDTINRVYKIASQLSSQWVKTNAVHKSGSGTNYVITGLDRVEETRHENQLGDGGNPINGEKKLPKKYREVECFTCKKKGHCANNS